MATSSIFTNIVISDPETAEKFIDALELSERAVKACKSRPDYRRQPIRDPETIRRIAEKLTGTRVSMQ